MEDHGAAKEDLNPMQQMRSRDEDKKKSPKNKFWNLSIWNKLNQIMVRHIDLSWNTLEPSLVLMHEKLIDLGWVYYNGEIHVVDPETEESLHHV